MKTTSIFLVLIFISQLCVAKEQTILPVEPWRAIVFMEKYSQNSYWDGNVSVKLMGNYAAADSLMVYNSMKLLNQLCETANLKFTNSDRGELEIYFQDSTNKDNYERLFRLREGIPSSYTYRFDNKIIYHYDLGLQLALVPENNHQHYITRQLAFALFPNQLPMDYSFKNGREIVNRSSSLFYSPSKLDPKPDKYSYALREFDSKILEAVYNSSFEELLLLAKKQYSILPHWLNENVKNLIVFPFILVSFLFAWLIVLFYRKRVERIQNKLLRFNAVTALSLIIVSGLGALFIILEDKISNPYFSFFQWYDVYAGILIATILSLLAANLIRIIEIFIQRHEMHKNAKVFLLFLSTSLIPSMAIFSIYYFGPNGLRETDIKLISTFFLLFTIIGVIRALISFFIIKEKEIKIETEVKLASMRELKTKAELNALHSKINPHFLYNALNSIAGLSKTDADKTEYMALSLSKLFRYSINKEQTDWSTLADEIEMVKIYLDIEKVRFDDRLEFNVDLPEDLKSTKIPRFMIQPLVENAVKHGVAPLVGKGEISICIQKEDKWLEISVADNGAEFPEELSPGFGLQSIYDKLEIMYHNRFELHFMNSPEKQILIKLA